MVELQNLGAMNLQASVPVSKILRWEERSHERRKNPVCACEIFYFPMQVPRLELNRSEANFCEVARMISGFTYIVEGLIRLADSRSRSFS
jgi:hypothetical protein